MSLAFAGFFTEGKIEYRKQLTKRFVFFCCPSFAEWTSFFAERREERKEELEMEKEELEPMYKVVMKFSPDYDPEKVCEYLGDRILL